MADVQKEAPYTAQTPGGYPDQPIGFRPPYIKWSTGQPVQLKGQGLNFQSVVILPVLGFTQFSIKIQPYNVSPSTVGIMAYRIYGITLGMKCLEQAGNLSQGLTQAPLDVDITCDELEIQLAIADYASGGTANLMSANIYVLGYP